MHRPRFRLVPLSAILVTALHGCATPEAATAAPRPAAAAASAGERQAFRAAPVDDTIATIRVTRQISMYYRLDLKKDNVHSPAMAGVMRAHEDSMRACYADRLDAAPRLRGKLALTFDIRKDSGTMTRIAKVGGDISDKPLLKCLARRLSTLRFDPPRDLHGNLQYTFDVSETTHVD